MLISLSEFFCVEVEPHELRRCLDYTSSECKLAAWYGDALLANFVSQRIVDQKLNNIGTMTRKKAHYVSNSTMKEFLLVHTDALSRLTDAASMSVHSFGTVFEALLELCNRKSGQVVAKNCADKYCDWVDANTSIPVTSIGISFCDFDSGFSGSTSICSNNPHSLESKEKINTMVLQDLRCWLKEAEVTKADAVRKKAVNVAKPMKPNSFGTIYSAKASGHIHDEILLAEWKSNSKKLYQDKYYRCCGVRKGVLTCLRPLWIDATDSCTHTGSLKIRDKKGVFQPGVSHYGKGKTPIWTCCGLSALAPGCVSTQSGNFILCPTTARPRPSATYLTKIKQWLKEYEHVVQQEEAREIGWDGVSQTSGNAVLTNLEKRRSFFDILDELM